MDLNAIKLGLFKHIGKGNSTYLLGCPWCIDTLIKFIHKFIVNIAIDMLVSSLKQGGTWNEELINNLAGSDLFSNIMEIPCNADPKEDIWLGREDPKGCSLTKSAYLWSLSNCLDLKDPWKGWHRLWWLHISPRIKIFGWKLPIASQPLPYMLHLVMVGLVNVFSIVIF